MDDIKRNAPPDGSDHSPHGHTPITEADLHAYVDGQLAPARQALVDQYLSTHPSELERVQDWRQQNALLRSLLNPVLDEPVPPRMAMPPSRRRPVAMPPWSWRGLAAGVLVALVSAGAAWMVRGEVDRDALQLALAQQAGAIAAQGELTGFARRAAVAHGVFSPDVRRPVEVGADQEQQLIAWLSKRLGTAVKPPSLQRIGYDLIGGRLLPGDSGPVAQFMYHDATGQRLTLYVTREVLQAADRPETAFHFGRDGPVNVFYWIDGAFGYAISGGANRAELMRVSQEVHRQLGAT